MRETSLLSLLKREEKAVNDVVAFTEAVEFWNKEREYTDWDEMVRTKKKELLKAEMDLTAVRIEIRSYFENVLNL